MAKKKLRRKKIRIHRVSRKTSRLSLTVIAVLVVGVGAAYGVWRSAVRTSDEYVESGRAYYESQRYPEAAIEFLNALRDDPGHRDARYLLARTRWSQRDLGAAVGELRSLLEYHPDDVEASMQLGTVYLSAGRLNARYFGDAKEIAQRVLASEPRHVGALILLGNALAGLEDYRSSAEWFADALVLDPGNVAALVALGSVQALQSDYEDAEQSFRRAREADPSSTGPVMALGAYYRATGDSGRAEELFREAVSIDPSDSAAYLGTARFLASEGRSDEAVGFLREIQELNPEDPTPSLTLAALHRSRAEEREALGVLRELKQRFPARLDVAVNLAHALLVEDPERAADEIGQVIERYPDEAIGHILHGELLFLGGEYAEALAALSHDTVARGLYPPVHLLLGRIAAGRADLETAELEYETALARDPDYLPALLDLAELYLGQGRRAEARSALEGVLEAGGASPRARLLDATLNTVEGRHPEAEAAYRALLAEQPDDAMIHLRMGLHYQLRGLRPEAEARFRRALELEPDSEEILANVVRFYAGNGDTPEALAILEAQAPESNRRAFHYGLLGLVYATDGRPEDAEAAYRQALDMEPGRIDVTRQLGDLYVRTGRMSEALMLIDALIALEPLDAGAYEARGLIFHALGDSRRAAENYSRSLDLNPRSFRAANNLARLLAEDGDLPTALNWAQAARRLNPDDATAADTLGRIQHTLGSHALAREQLQFAVAAEPGNPAFRFHLAEVYRATGQLDEAAAELTRLLETGAAFSERGAAEDLLGEIDGLR